MTILLIGVFLILLLLGVPVAFSMLLASLAALIYIGVDPIMVGLETSRSLASFYSFLAVPFFILAGELMRHGGLSEKIIDFVKSLIAHKKGGLAYATTISSQLFGSVSGASAATCAAVGGVMIPALEKDGYSRSFSAALTACSGTTGALIPPSIVLLIYGTLADVSIEQLFIAGIGPGIAIGLGIMLVSRFYAKKHNVAVEPKAPLSEIMFNMRKSALALGLTVIIFGGILGGVFTATEASAVAVVYTFFVGFFIYRRLKVRELPGIVLSAAKTTAALSFVLACAGLFSWTLSIGNVPQTITDGLIGFTDQLISPFADNLSESGFLMLRRVIILLFLNIMLIAFGMFIDIAPGLLIIVPVLLPISEEIGMGSGLEAVHFGLIVVTNMIIGLVTPPVGTTLFVASAVGKTSISSMVPHVLRFIAIMYIVQLIITYFPPASTFLPSLMK
jgi:tripartite ATP-independent transporter DctM subunit